jgi:phosphoribosylaminoimidazole-succinocarboxamide synthase
VIYSFGYEEVLVKRKGFDILDRSYFYGKDPGTLIQHFKDELHFNSDIIKIHGKGIINSRISAFIFQVLEFAGIDTVYLKRLNMRESLICQANIIPIQVVISNYSNESLIERYGIEEGQLDKPLVEFYVKHNNNFSIIGKENIENLIPMEDSDIDDIEELSLRINDILTGLFIAFGFHIVRIPMEFGFVHFNGDEEDESKAILFSSDITPDVIDIKDLKTMEVISVSSIAKDEPERYYQMIASRMGLIDESI